MVNERLRYFTRAEAHASFINPLVFAHRMGRIKTKPIKSAGDELYVKYGEHFTKEFDQNKAVLTQYAEVRSKKIRNILAGYLTKKAKLGE